MEEVTVARTLWRLSAPQRHPSRLRLEALEAREVPAIIQTGLPSWLPAGPSPVVNSTPQNITGTYNDPAVGPIAGVAFDPTDANRAYVAAAGGGIWRTNNANDPQPTYVPLTDNLPSLSTASLDVNPQNPNQLIAGLGTLKARNVQGNANEMSYTDFVGLYYSENATDPSPSFRVLGANTPIAGLSITNVLVRNGYILVGGSDRNGNSANDGVYLSSDNGFTFTKLDGVGGLPTQTGGGQKTYDLVADPAVPTRVYLTGQNGLFRTDNVLGLNGQPPTWLQLTSPLFTVGATTANSKVAIHSSAAGNVVYLANANPTNRGFEPSGVYFSLDLGVTWTQMDLPTTLTGQRGITDATNATPVAIKSVGHGLLSGDRVQVAGVTGNLAANGVWTVTVTDADTFTLNGSVGTGVYTGGGTWQRIVTTNPGGGAAAFFSLAADPTNPNLVYIGGATNVLRGDRSQPRTFDAIQPPFQWSTIYGNGALGTSPGTGLQSLKFDDSGILYAATADGLYRRSAPQTDLSAWADAGGTIVAASFSDVAYDSTSNVRIAGGYGPGTAEQVSGAGPVGGQVWNALSNANFDTVAVDNTSQPGVSIRYNSTGSASSVERRVFNANNVQVGPTSFLTFASPSDPKPGAGLSNGASPDYSRFDLNKVDPRLLMLSIAGKLYEDNDPAGFPGNVVADVTPGGLSGNISAVSYGGRQNGLNLPRISYVGTDSGQLFLRGAAGGYAQVTTLPGAGSVRSLVVDPDNWRDAFVLRGDTIVNDPANFIGSQVYHTTDGGLTWTDITENLYSNVVDSSGNSVGGLSSDVRTLALWDSAPGDSVGSGTVLLAGGAGGVYRYVPSIVAAGTGGWTEYGAGLPNAVVSTLALTGNRLTAATLGRGVWEVPDISPTIRAAAVVTVLGGDGDDNFTFGGSGTTSGTVFLSDGQGNSLYVGRNTGASFSFVGGKGADKLTIATNGQTGGDLQFVTGTLRADMGNDPGDTIVVSNQGRAVPTNVTVTATAVGAGTTDNLFGPGGSLVYSGLANGTLLVDLGTQFVGGNLVNVRSMSAGATQVLGTNGADAFVLNGQAGDPAEVGDLSGFFGTLFVDGRGQGFFGGGNTLAVNDFGATAGNANVNLVGNQILGIAGPTDAATVSYTNVTGLTVVGSNNAALRESFRVENVAAPLTLFNGNGADFVNVRAANNPVTIFGGPGAVTFALTSTAGDNFDGDLNGITAPVIVRAGAGDSRLVVSNYGNLFGAQYAVGQTSINGVTFNTIAGATPSPILFTTDGRFVGPDGTGVWLRGSNAGDDSFTVNATLGNGTQTAIDGNGGDDVYNASLENLGAGGAVTLRAGAGSNIVTLDSGVFGNTAASLAIVGDAAGTTRARVNGFAGSDKVTPALTVTDTVNGVFTGVGNPIAFGTLTSFDYDGRGGRNNFLYRDGTNVAFGTLDAPGAGIVYVPTGAASGTIRLAGVGPTVNLFNINGTDAAGLLIDGDANRTGARSTVTVVGVSDTNLGATGPLAGATALNGSDTFDVSDQSVAVYNESLGQLRSVAVVPRTVSTLLVLGGNETGKGDTFNVTPSRTQDILVDGQLPLRQRNGNVLTVNTAEGTTVERAANPSFGTTQTRIVTDSGASFAFKNFPNAAAVRGIIAVGADAGGGPRVRVYDAATNEVLFDRFVYDPSFTGGVRVATGDVNGDGVPDLVVAAGVGGGPHIQVFDGVTFAQIANFFAYETTFRGGSFVSVGDLNGDGKGEILVGAGVGGGPLVKVFDGFGRALTAFFAYDSAFRGGVRVASGDVNGDGRDDIVTGAGPGGGPQVKVFNASDLRVLSSYFAFDPTYTGGVYVAAGDVNGDGTADVITGPGSNAVPEINVRDSRTGVAMPVSIFNLGILNSPDPLPSVGPNVLSADGGEDRELGGIRVATVPGGPDGVRRIVTSRGPGYAPRLNFYTVDPLAAAGNFVAFETEFVGGVYVG
jgi:hypothetical protein